MNPVTTIVISDRDLLQRLVSATGQIVFQTADGQHVRTVEPVSPGTPANYNCPFTEDELDAFSKERTGRPLADILGDLEQKYGG